MSYWQRLWRVQLAGITALAMFSAALALLFMLEAVLVSPQETDALEMLIFVFLLGLFYGFIPSLFLGAPAYTALCTQGASRWVTMLIIAIVPGVAMMLYHFGLGLIAVIAGPTILFVTHRLYRRWYANDS